MNNENPDQANQASATILGRPAFEQLRKRIAAEKRARRHAVAARSMALQKRVVTRMLNKERDRPQLRIVK